MAILEKGMGDTAPDRCIAECTLSPTTTPGVAAIVDASLYMVEVVVVVLTCGYHDLSLHAATRSST